LTDKLAFGDLYQWGRLADGHQNRNSPTTTEKSANDVPGHSKFIATLASPNWREPLNLNLWQGISGINNPCPQGFRLPTQEEFEFEQASWVSNDAAGAFASPLKLTLTGYRDSFVGDVFEGDGGLYWTSTVLYNHQRHFLITENGAGIEAGLNSAPTAVGMSVRCIKD
jgi:hypothetical protein